ncbi:DUF6328 family protein [Streptomyces sp. NPDC048295]|uniref:DUF6328 family protein n=1 Tax=Streptomyces sp. NPDC048295 TaxID=3154617 RepID=UPI0034292E1C
MTSTACLPDGRGRDDGRHETPEERADRRWTDLLQELRVALHGSVAPRLVGAMALWFLVCWSVLPARAPARSSSAHGEDRGPGRTNGPVSRIRPPRAPGGPRP